MACVKDMERLIAEDTGYFTERDLDVRTRKGREEGWLPTGGRGLNAPALTPASATAVLISLASEQACHATEAVSRLSPLKADNGQVFAEALAEILAEPRAAAGVAEVELGRNVPTAKVIFLDGRTIEFSGGVAEAVAIQSEIGIDGTLLVKIAELIEKPVHRGPKMRRPEA
jgi:hypothetical protein